MPRPLPDAVRAVTDGDADAVRRHILSAANRVIAKRGLAAATTRAIAEEAGLAGGTLYNYFDGHVHLVAKAIVHNAIGLMGAVATLPSRVGRFTVAGNLRYFVRQSAEVLGQLVPAFAAAFSDPGLLAAVRREMAAIDLVDDPGQALERYLRAERDLGRVSEDTDCRTVAAVIVSLCHDDAFQDYLRGGSRNPRSRDKEIDFIVRAITAR